MRCLKSDFIPGSIFHIYNHVIDGFSLFEENQDYHFFLLSIEKQLEKYPASIIAYCLMPNHYHLLIKQVGENKIYKTLNYAFISYAKYFNKKHNRKGPIFRSPLQHKEITDAKYLKQICKYIHLNPVYADLVEKPEQWDYSNYLEWINKRNNTFYYSEIKNKYFGSTENYIAYIESNKI